jgi:transcription antitermination protein NusB
VTADKKPRAGGKAARSDARERAMHILYEADTKGLTGTEVLAMQVLSIDDLTTEIVTGVSTHLGELDSHIVECANGWTLARMPVIDRNVLRMAVYELSYSRDVPVAVVINEAVELAKTFSTDDSGRFVNGVLSAISKVVRVTS